MSSLKDIKRGLRLVNVTDVDDPNGAESLPVLNESAEFASSRVRWMHHNQGYAYETLEAALQMEEDGQPMGSQELKQVLDSTWGPKYSPATKKPRGV